VPLQEIPELAATQALVSRQIESKQPEKRFDAIPLALTAALTLVAVLVHGYHPYAEDGGIYLPGIFKLIHPDLYPTWTGFVTAQTRFSFFAPTIAAVVRLTGIGVMQCVFGVYVLSMWGTLYAAWLITSRCAKSRNSGLGAVVILALCITAPAAGTSLLLMDPYVTARSISTPCGLLAIVGALDFIAGFKQTSRIRFRPLAVSAISLLVAALMHPLMACYAAGCVVLLFCAAISSPGLKMAGFGAVSFFAIVVGTVLKLVAPTQSGGYTAVALSRDYWFMSAWHWYEIVGLVAPLLVLWAIARSKLVLNERGRWLVQMAIMAGVIGIAVSLLFAHPSAHSYFVAMLQPLRIFQMVYIVMLLVIGTYVAANFLHRDPGRWVAICVVLGALMFLVQIETFPHSAHVEVPWTSPANDWERGFVWIRNNTPIGTTFALDANYIDSPGEDAQSFRAVAERSSVPDYIKDGGIAAIDPGLTAEWAKGEAIQSGLGSDSDQQRRSKLVQARIHWLVLPSASATNFDCPYRNTSMKVCRVPEQ
jgi:hypothetical protein